MTTRWATTDKAAWWRADTWRWCRAAGLLAFCVISYRVAIADQIMADPGAAGTITGAHGMATV